MGIPMDYGPYAATYAKVRWAVPWVAEPLARRALETHPAARILEIGCGTGNYVEAVRVSVPDRVCLGIDRSREMIAQAVDRSRGGVAYAVADADDVLPLKTATIALAFVVDVLHHLTNYPGFFREVARVLAPGGALVAVTDSEENIRRRTLSRFFPEVLEIELRRYPPLEDLEDHARNAGLEPGGVALAEGFIDLDETFIFKLEAKCSSAIRQLSAEAHRRGIDRVREASRRGERWLSSYSVIRYAR